MARKSMLRGVLAGHAAVVGLLALCGAATPLAVGRDAAGVWGLDLKAALADSGRGGGSGSGSGGDGGGSSGSGSSGGDDGSGSGSGGDDGGSSGPGSDSDDGGGRHRSGSGLSAEDEGERSPADDDSGRDRPRATVELSDRELNAVLGGERVLVDDRGRVLEVEIEIEHGTRTVTVKPHGGDLKRDPAPIGGVRVVDAARTPASRVVVDPRNGALEVEIEHGVVTTKPHGGGPPAAIREPVQVGRDLTPAEEATLIQGGWR